MLIAFEEWSGDHSDSNLLRYPPKPCVNVTEQKKCLRDSTLTTNYRLAKYELKDLVFVRGFKTTSSVAFAKRIGNAFKARVPSFLAPLKRISKKRVLEIDILRTVAILLLILYHVPGIASADVPVTVVTSHPLELVGFMGVCIFFFVSFSFLK
jgi:hypothetical protein